MGAYQDDRWSLFFDVFARGCPLFCSGVKRGSVGTPPLILNGASIPSFLVHNVALMYEFCQYYQTHQHIKLHEKYQNTKIPLFSINKYRKIPQKINNPKNTFENPRVLLGPILHSYIGAILMYQE